MPSAPHLNPRGGVAVLTGVGGGMGSDRGSVVGSVVGAVVVSGAELARQKQAWARLRRMPPEAAVARILQAIVRREARLPVGDDARRIGNPV